MYLDTGVTVTSQRRRRGAASTSTIGSFVGGKFDGPGTTSTEDQVCIYIEFSPCEF